jgi:predicted nucleic acid-binding protein
MDKILIDSDAFVAQSVVTDSSQERATRQQITIENDNFQQFTTNLVVAETATVLSRRFSQVLAIEFLNKIFRSEVEIIYLGEGDFLKIAEKFKSYTKKNISFVDSANLVVADELHISKIFSFDKIYGEKRIK